MALKWVISMKKGTLLYWIASFDEQSHCKDVSSTRWLKWWSFLSWVTGGKKLHQICSATCIYRTVFELKNFWLLFHQRIGIQKKARHLFLTNFCKFDFKKIYFPKCVPNFWPSKPKRTTDQCLLFWTHRHHLTMANGNQPSGGNALVLICHR